MTPIDWDHESRCMEGDCINPATHRRINGMADDVPVYEMICCDHARGEMIIIIEGDPFTRRLPPR